MQCWNLAIPKAIKKMGTTQIKLGTFIVMFKGVFGEDPFSRRVTALPSGVIIVSSVVLVSFPFASSTSIPFVRPSPPSLAAGVGGAIDGAGVWQGVAARDGCTVAGLGVVVDWLFKLAFSCSRF